MEYGASCEDVARVCHAHPVGLSYIIFGSDYLRKKRMPSYETLINLSWTDIKRYIFTFQFKPSLSTTSPMKNMYLFFSHSENSVFLFCRLCPKHSGKLT